eukprot:365852-Chlamydomonas_euryale.AAC.1
MCLFICLRLPGHGPATLPQPCVRARTLPRMHTDHLSHTPGWGWGSGLGLGHANASGLERMRARVSSAAPSPLLERTSLWLHAQGLE